MDERRPSHLSGFDWLRAFMSVAVVLWHGHAFGMSELFGREFALPYRPCASDLLDFNVLLVAVPTFITIACFLYGRGQDGPNALSRRLRRLGLLLSHLQPLPAFPRTAVTVQANHANQITATL